MDFQLKNKTALVTGSTAGIGFTIAKLLALEGAHVIVTGRTETRVIDAIKNIKAISADAKLTPFAADLSEPQGIDALLKKIPNVDILINNLGIYEVKPFADISDADWLRLFNVNVMSGVRLSRHYLTPMLKNKWGRIIFISSESGVQIPADMIHYGMTKTAQLAIARGLAETTAGTNITVNSVLPGPTASEGVTHFVENFAKQQAKTKAQIEEEFFQFVRPTSLLKRFATPEEVATLVVYLSSPLSSATNGAALRVDGGIVKSII